MINSIIKYLFRRSFLFCEGRIWHAFTRFMIRVHFVSEQLFMHAAEQDYDDWPVKYACNSELINTKQNAQVHYDLMELHFFQSQRKYSFAQPIIKYHKYEVYEVISHRQWTYYAKE